MELRHATAIAALVSCLAACGGVYEPAAEAGAGKPGGGSERPPGQENGAGGGSLEGAPEEARRGAALFAQYCAACHGADAARGAVYAGSIQGRTRILDQVRSGGGGMPAFGADQLSDGDVAAIEAFLAWLASGGAGGAHAGRGSSLAVRRARAAGRSARRLTPPPPPAALAERRRQLQGGWRYADAGKSSAR